MDLQNQTFIHDLTKELVRSGRNSYSDRDNYDHLQKPRTTSELPSNENAELKQALQNAKEHFKNLVRPFYQLYRALGRSFLRLWRKNFAPARYFQPYAVRYSEFGYLYSRLRDQTSRDLLRQIAAYRIMGHRHVKLPRNTTEYWAAIEDLQKLPSQGSPLKIKFMDAQLPCLDLQSIGFPLRSYVSVVNAACAFVQRQYEFRREGVVCRAEPGDIVIDAGGCWGENSLYFAHEVGPTGKVYTFEFIPGNLEVLHKNLAQNPELAKRIELVKHPVWKTSDKKLYYVDWGPGSNVFSDKNERIPDGECLTLSIDDLVQLRAIPRLNFIKMDIEGAELDALKGAETSIRKFRPKLAISLYHQVSDFTTIPKYLDSLNLGYDFFLDHHTIHQNETVLFAIPRALS